MINGILACILFLVWIWLGFRIADRIKQAGWSKGDVDTFGILWIINLAAYLGGVSRMVDTCGNMGDLLLAWATLVLGLVAIVAALFLTGTVLVVVIGFVVLYVPREAWSRLPTRTQERLSPRRHKKVLFLVAGLAFVAFCGWLGGQPNPACTTEVVQAANVQAADVQAIKAVLVESAPELVDDFEFLLAEVKEVP